MDYAQTTDEVTEDLLRRSELALAQRRANGEIMTYVQDGWVVREFPGQRVERLCRLEDFESADFPVLAPTECQHPFRHGRA